MTDAPAPVPADTLPRSRFGRWLRSEDPELLVVKRSVRAAVVMPSVFALTHTFFSNPQVALFGAFGSFALLLLVEFTGPLRTRLISYLGLYVVGGCFIVLGTVVSSDKVAAVVAMGLVGFDVLFAGVVAPQAATASTAALLMFVLPVSVSVPAAAAGPRIVGWTLAAAFSITACLVVWPAPWHDELRRRLAATISAVARLADARARGTSDSDAHAAVTSELTRLRNQFSGTPYPPTAAASNAVALSKLVGRVEWVAGNTAMVGDQQWSTEPLPAQAVTAEVADTLHQTAALICDGDAHPIDDPERISAVQHSARRLDALIGTALRADVSSLTDAGQDPSSQKPGTPPAARGGAEGGPGRFARSGLPRPGARYRHRVGCRRRARGGGRGVRGRPADGDGRRVCLARLCTEARLTLFLSLGMVPQCPAGGDGFGPWPCW
jgi:hypothetical protein